MAVDNPRFWDRAARKYAADPIEDMAGYERSLEHSRQYLKSTDAVIEIGCGTGTTALSLAPSVARYVATDFSSEMIAIAREKAAAARLTVTFEVAAADAAQPDASFDVALAFNVLHLVPDRASVLANVARLLKPGGVFISKTPCLKEMNFAIRLAVPLMQAIGRAPYVAFFSAEELERDVATAGFEFTERARHGTRGKDVRSFLVARKR
jgi:ubiquinone/menaquinone biosynthesis C-methylase UbiE